MSVPCTNCGHAEDDHDGYGGMCDGFGFTHDRSVCPCIAYTSGRKAPCGHDEKYQDDYGCEMCSCEDSARRSGRAIRRLMKSFKREIG